MKVTFLGTNGWFDNPAGYTVCILIETKTEYLILDAGGGLAFADIYIKKPKPIYLYISHMHLDHTIGLHLLNTFNFKQGIKILVPRKLLKPIKTLMSPPYTSPPQRLRFPVSIVPSSKWKNIPLNIKIYPMTHSVPCFGLRFESEGKVISYSADTGLCANLEKLAKNSDLLITECAYRPGETNVKWPHLNPQIAAGLAKQVKAKKLALVHFDAKRYPTFASRQKALKVAKKTFKNTVLPKNFGQINI
jgi:ribonuclease BN (tRNA processing enzyme)